jgi:hypothetical protein
LVTSENAATAAVTRATAPLQSSALGDPDAGSLDALLDDALDAAAVEDGLLWVTALD